MCPRCRNPFGDGTKCDACGLPRGKHTHCPICFTNEARNWEHNTNCYFYQMWPPNYDECSAMALIEIRKIRVALGVRRKPLPRVETLSQSGADQRIERYAETGLVNAPIIDDRELTQWRKRLFNIWKELVVQQKVKSGEDGCRQLGRFAGIRDVKSPGATFKTMTAEQCEKIDRKLGQL